MANYCGNCGTQLEEDTVFCSNCGFEVQKENIELEEEKRFDPMTGKPLKKYKKKRGRLFSVISVCLLATVVVAIILVKSGVVLSKSDRVLLALQHTMEESQLIKDLSQIKLVRKNNFTVDLDGRIQGEKVNVLYVEDNSDKQIIWDLNDNDAFEASLVKDNIMFRELQNPDDVLLYQYRKAPSVELAEAAGEENIEVLNTIIEKEYDEKLGRKLLKKGKDILLKKLRSLEFERTSTKKFDIKNKKRKCKGYSVEISKHDMLDLIYQIYDMQNKELSEVYATKNDFFDRPQWDEIEDGVENQLEEMECQIKFYLYKDMLVGVELETEAYFIEVNLGGEESVLEDIDITCEKFGHEYAHITVKGKNRDGKEVFDIQKNDLEYALVTYDYKDGNLEIACDNQGIYLEAELEVNSKEIMADVSSLVVDYDEIYKGTVRINKGGKVEKLEGEQSFFDAKMAKYIKENGWKIAYYHFLKAINRQDVNKISKKYPQLTDAAKTFIEYNYYTLYDYLGENDSLSPTDELWFSLIYLDDDEIPELYIEGDYQGLLVRYDGKTLQGIKWREDTEFGCVMWTESGQDYYYHEKNGLLVQEAIGQQLNVSVCQYEGGVCREVECMSAPTEEEEEEYRNQAPTLIEGLDEITEENMKTVLGL